jgi:hypothetical protein
MKAYLLTTGTLFALLALAHVLRTIAEWSQLERDPWFLLQGPGIGLIGAGLALWAWRLLRSQA